MSDRTTKTSAWTEWTFTTAEFLEKLGLPPGTGIIAVRISFHDHDRTVTVIAPVEAAPLPPRRPRLRSCVEAWPDCETGEYNPACCRFPKSCSATIYDDERVSSDDLEPADA